MDQKASILPTKELQIRLKKIFQFSVLHNKCLFRTQVSSEQIPHFYENKPKRDDTSYLY